MRQPTFAQRRTGASADAESFSNSYCRMEGCGREIAAWSVEMCGHHSLAAYREVRDHFAEFRAAADGSRVPPATHHVYYARFGAFIKIGTTIGLRARMSTLKAAQPDWELLAVEPGDRTLERERHLQFAACRQPRSELFAPTPQLQKHIKDVRQQFGVPII